jgi:hypothetical protein
MRWLLPDWMPDMLDGGGGRLAAFEWMCAMRRGLAREA